MLPIEIFPAQDLKGKYCLSPFVQVSIDPNGNVGICGCSIWQPTMVGNIFQNTLTEILANERACAIRQSIIDGTYIYCHPDKCGILRERNLNDYHTLPQQVKWAVEDSARSLHPHHIVLGMDRTCNLWCPSCRKSVVKNNDDDKEKQKFLSTVLTKNLFSRPTTNPIELTMDVSGDLFASPFLLDFVNGISSADFPNLKLDLVSNGILAPSRWHRLGEMQNHVHKITISYDAATSETYEQLRRGGEWKDIMRAMDWLKNKKAENGMELHTRMVVQKDNYKEMQAFYELSKSFTADTVQFQRLVNWGTFSSTEFKELDVFDSSSNCYNDAIEHLKPVINCSDAQFWHGIPKIS